MVVLVTEEVVVLECLDLMRYRWLGWLRGLDLELGWVLSVQEVAAAEAENSGDGGGVGRSAEEEGGDLGFG